MQHFDRCLLKLGNGDLPILELSERIHTAPEVLHEIQDDSGIRESRRHFEEKIFPDINASFHAPQRQLIFGWQKGQY